MGKKIICLGNAVVDVVVKNSPETTPDKMIQFSDTIKFGLGGDAVNEAVTLSAMGYDVDLFTSIGDDTAGNLFMNMLTEKGIKTSGIIKDTNYQTTITIIVVQPDGEHNCMILHKGMTANMRYSRKIYDIDFTDVKALSIGSLFWSRNQTDGDLTDLMKAAKDAGVTTFADMVLEQPQMGLKDIENMMKYTDYLVPSLYEASYYTKKDTPEEIAGVFHDHGVKNVVLKLGDKGVFASSEGKHYYIPSIAENVVDTIGGGDNFVAGFIAGKTDGMNIEDALYFGSATAAIAISGYGANGVVKSKAQVEEYLKKHRN